MHDMAGQLVGHYRVIQPIGHTRMSTTFIAEDIRLLRKVALKVFWRREQEAQETKDFFRRFAREARVLAQLDHPNILPVFDYGEQAGFAYLVMPYITGDSLKQLLRARRRLPETEAVQLIIQILRALQYAHERDLIHRDIKPDNMLF